MLGTVPTRPLRRGRAGEPDPADFALPLVALDYARQGTVAILGGPMPTEGAGTPASPQTVTPRPGSGTEGR